MKNVTITLPEDLARWVRVRAAENERSVSKWIAELLEGMRSQEDEYDVAMKRFLARRANIEKWNGWTVASRRARSCMTGPVFVDTNVFVYLHGDSEPAKKLRADEWIAYLIGRQAGRLSFQVLQELLFGSHA